MKSYEIRSRFLEFFKKRGHTILPSAPLIPENDPTVLFNTAGMQPLVPFLMGKKHPGGSRLADAQKCLRTTDIDDIGDNTHATFFEMLGNWSLGDYFKEDAITWSYQFLFSKEGLDLDPKRLYVTVFAGDENAPRDLESFEIWKKVGIPEHRIYFKGADSNWWPAVKGKDTWTGPTGPCSEMFYDITEEGLGDLTHEEEIAAEDSQKIVEIWNDVFMEYEKKDGKITSKLTAHNVDTGAGLERISAVMQKKLSIFDTDIFELIMAETKKLTDTTKSARIIADHIRASTFLIADGARPSNTDQGYILRRLLRRAIFNASSRTLTKEQISSLVDAVISTYRGFYPELPANSDVIKKTIEEEAVKFGKTLAQGMKEFEKITSTSHADAKNLEKVNAISGKDAFMLFSSYGFPIDMTKELAKEKGIAVDIAGFDEEFKKHQELSRAGSPQKFKGGLSDTSEMSVKYHTATHLLHQALYDVLGDSIMQKGSNITPERLRFDFSHPAKMTDEEKKKVEDIVNAKIAAALPVNSIILPKDEALKTGAKHFFGEKYGDQVSIYYVGHDLASAYSKEFCGGPHVQNTSELGKFRITKEEASSAGIRRIKAVLE
jgi:alanyl-tRNA synthetase